MSTSTDAGASTHYALVTPSGAVSDVSVGLTDAASRASGVVYKIGFTASATGALVAGSGTITVAAAAGTKLPNCALVTDLATHSSVDSCAHDAAPAATMTVTTGVAIAAGDQVQLVFDGATNASVAGTHSLGVSTSTDAGGRATYALVASGALEGRVIDSEHNVVQGGIVQACLSTNRTCYTAQISETGLYVLFVPLGTYALTAYPQSKFLGEATAPGTAALSSPASIARRTITVPALAPLPHGVDIAGQDSGVPGWRWDAPAPMAVHNCRGGIGEVSVTLRNSVTGKDKTVVALLVESPLGSGTYKAVIPPLTPGHGAATVRYNFYCPTAVFPLSGPSSGGAKVLINGTGFTGATAVYFGNAAATSYTVLSSRTVQAVTPPGSGTVAVTVVTPRGRSAGGRESDYSYVDLSSVSPARGPSSGGARVVIKGSGASPARSWRAGPQPQRPSSPRHWVGWPSPPAPPRSPRPRRAARGSQSSAAPRGWSRTLYNAGAGPPACAISPPSGRVRTSPRSSSARHKPGSQSAGPPGRARPRRSFRHRAASAIRWPRRNSPSGALPVSDQLEESGGALPRPTTRSAPILANAAHRGPTRQADKSGPNYPRRVNLSQRQQEMPVTPAQPGHLMRQALKGFFNHSARAFGATLRDLARRWHDPSGSRQI